MADPTQVDQVLINLTANARDAMGTGGRLIIVIDEVVLVDQSPIGRTPRSNPVTYIKAFDAIREVFASTPDAKRRGYSALPRNASTPANVISRPANDRS